MFVVNAIHKSYLVALAVLFFVPNLFGAGYTFIKKKGFPERLIPQDCSAGQVPEVAELTPTQTHLYALQKTTSEVYVPGHGGYYKKVSWRDSSGEAFKTKIEPYLDIIEKILENEQKYAQTHYMFYHAQNGSFRFLQDFLKEFYALLNIRAPFTHFEFLRAWHEAVPEADINQFLDDESDTIKYNYNFDCLPEMKPKLLSVNLSLFGNDGVYGSCTFDYFQNSFSYTPFDIEWIAESITKVLGLQLTDNERESLRDLFNNMGSSGSLFQICIPREQVDRCVYLCHIYGIPYKQKLVSDCYDVSKGRHTRISDILDWYTNPSFASDFYQLNELQARILLSQDIMLNPNSGVKLFRFTRADNQDKYQEELAQFVHTVAARYLAETSSFDKKNNSPFNRLATMIFNK